MKFLIVTDTHSIDIENIENLRGLDYDYIITLGDVDLQFLFALKNIAKNNILGILGNHDAEWYLEKSEIFNFDKKVVEFGNITVAGLSGSWRYKESNAPLLTDEESIQILNNIPKVDILFSHDTAKNLYEDSWCHPGLLGISEYIKNKNPILNIHGHHHKNKIQKLHNTTIISLYSIAIIEVEKIEDNLNIKNLNILY